MLRSVYASINKIKNRTLTLCVLIIVRYRLPPFSNDFFFLVTYKRVRIIQRAETHSQKFRTFRNGGKTPRLYF